MNDNDPRNELGRLAPEDDQRCVAAGVVFARQHTVTHWRRPLLVTSAVPMADIACDGLSEAYRLLVADGARLAVPVELDAGTALAHSVSPVLTPLE